MKTMILIIAVFFYVQPVTAVGCDMSGGTVPAGIADQPMEHPMEGEHDCCDETPADPQESCDHGVECSTCTAGALAVAVSQGLALPFAAMRGWQEAILADIPSHSFPLYKPPIS